MACEFRFDEMYWKSFVSILVLVFLETLFDFIFRAKWKNNENNNNHNLNLNNYLVDSHSLSMYIIP